MLNFTNPDTNLFDQILGILFYSSILDLTIYIGSSGDENFQSVIRTLWKSREKKEITLRNQWVSYRELSLTGILLARSFISSWRTAEPPRPGEERQQTGGSPSSVHLPRCTLHCTPLYCTHSLPPTQHLSQPVWLAVSSVITSDLEMLINIIQVRDLPDYPIFDKSSYSQGKGS